VFTISDVGGGIQSILVTTSANADTPVPPFVVGDTGPITVTATKIDQSMSSTVAMRITDTSGNVTFCRLVFGPGGSPSTLTLDTQAPTCGVSSTAGPPAQATFTLQDTESGLASVVVTLSNNADTVVPPFSVGTTGSLVVTATKIDQSQTSSVTLVVTDVAGFSRTCTATFLPLVVTAARVRGLSATATGQGVRMRWRTASEIGVTGFNVYRSIGARRVRLNRVIIAAHGGAAAHTSRAARYWVQAVNADGSRTWFGPARLARSSP